MIHGESRFFTNWQMSKEISSLLHKSDSDGERNKIINHWVYITGICDRIQFRVEDQKEKEKLISVLQ